MKPGRLHPWLWLACGSVLWASCTSDPLLDGSSVDATAGAAGVGDAGAAPARGSGGFQAGDDAATDGGAPTSGGRGDAEVSGGASFVGSGGSGADFAGSSGRGFGDAGVGGAGFAGSSAGVGGSDGGGQRFGDGGGGGGAIVVGGDGGGGGGGSREGGSAGDRAYSCACSKTIAWVDGVNLSFSTGDCLVTAGQTYVYIGAKPQTYANPACNPASQAYWCTESGNGYIFERCE